MHLEGKFEIRALERSPIMGQNPELNVNVQIILWIIIKTFLSFLIFYTKSAVCSMFDSNLTQFLWLNEISHFSIFIIFANEEKFRGAICNFWIIFQILKYLATFGILLSAAAEAVFFCNTGGWIALSKKKLISAFRCLYGQ